MAQLEAGSEGLIETFPSKAGWSEFTGHSEWRTASLAVAEHFIQSFERYAPLNPEALEHRHLFILPLVGNFLFDMKRQIQNSVISVLINLKALQWKKAPFNYLKIAWRNLRWKELKSVIPELQLEILEKCKCNSGSNSESTQILSYLPSDICRHYKKSQDTGNVIALHLRKRRKNLNGNYPRLLIIDKYTPSLLGKNFYSFSVPWRYKSYRVFEM